MIGFGTLMIIFGIGIILAGLYLFTGHYSDLLLWRAHMKYKSKTYLRYLGKVVICVGLSPLICGIWATMLEEDSAGPIIAFPISLVIILIIAINTFKIKDEEKKEDEDIKE